MTTTVVSPPQSRTILVVEDEYHIRRLLGEGLSAEGFEVRTAATPREALDMVEQVDPDVVLLDLMLPGVDGLKLAGDIHDRISAPIVAMSASYSLLEDARKLECVADTIPKPFEWDELVKDLHNQIASRDRPHASVT